MNGAPTPRLKHRIEYAGLLAAAAFCRLLPYRVALFLAWGVAALLHFIFGFRRAEAYRRIRLVLGETTPPARVRSIAWISFRNLCFNAVEVVRFPVLSSAWIEQHMDMQATASVMQKARAEGRGIILAVPHAGSWDFAGAACRNAGYTIFSIARRQKNPLTDGFLNRMRESAHIPAVMNEAALLRKVIKRLRAGEVLALLPDVRARTKAYPIPFLGGIANIGGGPALFARQTGVQILPCFASRMGWTKHSLVPFAPISPDPSMERDADIERMMRELMSRLNECILAHPEQYFWFNKRWVLDPIDITGAPRPSSSTP